MPACPRHYRAVASTTDACSVATCAAARDRCRALHYVADESLSAANSDQPVPASADKSHSTTAESAPRARAGVWYRTCSMSRVDAGYDAMMNGSVMDWIRDRALTLVLMAMFALFLGGQVLTGLYEYNATQADHQQPVVDLAGYLRTGHPWEALFENWESEFLQMAVFVLLTTILVQKGSPESRRRGRQGARRRGPAGVRSSSRRALAGSPRRMDPAALRALARAGVRPAVPALVGGPCGRRLCRVRGGPGRAR